MLESYKNRMRSLGGYDGEFRRRNAQKIMDASWMRDPATKPVYVKWVDSGLPEISMNDIPVYAKYNVKSYHNITGDEVAYLLQFRLEDIRTNPDIKVGSYVSIINEMGDPEWWLITHFDDRAQFRQFSILKCLWTYQWVSRIDGKKTVHQCLAPPRNQNSYNSGTWLDYTFQIVENQSIAIMPTNDDTRTISYDTKFLISEPGRYPPIAWKVSKIFNSFNGEVTRFTMTQEQFNPATDDAEHMIANYYDGLTIDTKPEDNLETPEAGKLEIIYSGSPAVKAGGSYKKFTVKKYDDGELIDIEDPDIQWSVDPIDTDDKNYKFNRDEFQCKKDKNVCKITCSDYEFIGNQFIITAYVQDTSVSIVAEVISL